MVGGTTKRFPGVARQRRASTSRCSRARCTHCLARTAQGRARSRTSSRGSTARTRASSTRRRARGAPLPARGHRSRYRHGAPALPPGRAIHRRRERRARRHQRSGPRVPTSYQRHRGARRGARGALPHARRSAARIWQLSVGEQQRVEILKALYRDARVLILDEPTAVLTPQEADALFVTLRQMADEGRAVIFISHKLHEVIAVSDRVTVLRQGRSVGDRRHRGCPRASARLADGRPRRRHGPSGSPRRPDRRHGSRARRRQRDGRPRRGRGAERPLTMHAGEIVGLAGVAGNGQRELAEVITGMRPLAAGASAPTASSSAPAIPRAAIQARHRSRPRGSPRHRRRTGLSIASNTVLKAYRSAGLARPVPAHARHPAQGGRSDRALRRADAWPRYPGAGPLGRQPPEGRARRASSGEPAVLVARRPDPRARRRGDRDGARLPSRRGLGGIAVLLISEDLDEMLALSDRIAVMYEGRIVGVSTPPRATVEDIGLMMAGVARMIRVERRLDEAALARGRGAPRLASRRLRRSRDRGRRDRPRSVRDLQADLRTRLLRGRRHHLHADRRHAAAVHRARRRSRSGSSCGTSG